VPGVAILHHIHPARGRRQRLLVASFGLADLLGRVRRCELGGEEAAAGGQ
jgi:hypothetical protein